MKNKLLLWIFVFLLLPIAFAITASDTIFSDVAANYNTNSPVPGNSLGQIALTDIGGVNNNIALNIFVDYFGSKLYLVFKNEETGLIINDTNITLQVISPIIESHLVTDGYLTINITETGLYQFYFSGDGYLDSNDFINIPEFQDTEKTLYMLESINGVDVTVNIIDDYRKPVEGAYVKVLKLNTITGNYEQVQTSKTNFDGQTKINAVLNSVFYQFIIEYPFGDIRSTTSQETNIYENTITFQISIEDQIGESFFNSNGINRYLEFNNNTNEFIFTFSDIDNEDQYICLETYRSKITGNVLFNSTCLTSSSGILKVGVLNTSGVTYTAKAFATNNRNLLDQLSYRFVNNVSVGRLGVVMVVLLTLVFIFIAFWDISIGFVLIPLPQVFGTIIGIVDIPLGISISLEVIFIVLAIMVSTSKRG